MKKSKVFIAMLLVLAMIMLCACSSPTAGPVAQTASPAAETTSPDAETAAPTETTGDGAAASAADFNGKLQAPFIVTSCGQSPGAVMVNMVAAQAGLDSSNDNSLSVDTFEPGDAKTLIVTTGTSGKGMGAAGTDVNAEIDRCAALIKAAREAGMTICCAHVEGMARRTDSADQASIDAIMELADVVLIIEESDSDGLFTNYTTEHDIPLLKVKDALDIGSVLE